MTTSAFRDDEKGWITPHDDKSHAYVIPTKALRFAQDMPGTILASFPRTRESREALSGFLLSQE